MTTKHTTVTVTESSVAMSIDVNSESPVKIPVITTTENRPVITTTEYKPAITTIETRPATI